MAAKLAVWLKPVSDALGIVYIPAMWVLVVIYGLIGVLGLLSPGIVKGQLAMARGNGRMRLFGVYLLLLGVLVFSQAALFANPIVPQAISFAVFLLGGVLLLIPAVGLIPLEWAQDRGPSFFRLIALVNILIAGLFYSATRVMPPAEPAPDTDPITIDDSNADFDARPDAPSPATTEPSDAPVAPPTTPDAATSAPAEPNATVPTETPTADTQPSTESPRDRHDLE